MTKKGMQFICCLTLFLVLVPTTALSITKTWTTTTLTSLEHGEDYTWRVADNGTSWFIPSEEVITSAYVDIENLYNWAVEDDDYLNIFLLDRVGSITNTYWRWWTEKTLLTQFTDLNEGQSGNRYEDFHYDLTAAQITALTSYLTDGKFGLGLDPNCHYYDSKIKFTVVTEAVPTPEPSSLLLLGLALAGVAGIGRRMR